LTDLARFGGHHFDGQKKFHRSEYELVECRPFFFSKLFVPKTRCFQGVVCQAKDSDFSQTPSQILCVPPLPHHLKALGPMFLFTSPASLKNMQKNLSFV